MKIGNISIGDDAPTAFICGPCVIEENIFEIAEALADLPIIFKASFDKANRSSIHSYRGPGLEEGLRILEKIRTDFGLPIYTDVHTPEQARAAGEVCDAIQIPAFLCRQTDLLVAAGKTGKPVGVKKGQFMAPWDMKNVIEKIGHNNVLLIERGTSFGYNNLVVDYRSILEMKELGCPVCFDATHSTQLPGVGGQSKYALPLAKAAIAVGADALFIETHPSPADALSDSTTQIDFETLRELMAHV